MTAAQVNGITIEYDVHGPDDGEPVLLVMGLGGQLIAWPMEFVDRLTARGMRVIRYDNRDIGLSTKIDAPPPTRRAVVLSTLSRRFAHSPYLLSDMAGDGIGLLDHLGIAQAHVVGVSMGGMIAQTMAIEHADRVATLTSIMSNTGDRKHGRISAKLMRKLPRLMSRNPDDAIDRGVEIFRLISGPEFDAMAIRELTVEAMQRCADVDGTARQTMAIASSPDRTESLRGVTAPTLVIHGLVDPLVMPSGGIATAKAIPGSRLMMFADMGHDLPEQRLADIVDAIAEHVLRRKVGAT